MQFVAADFHLYVSIELVQMESFQFEIYHQWINLSKPSLIHHPLAMNSNMLLMTKLGNYQSIQEHELWRLITLLSRHSIRASCFYDYGNNKTLTQISPALG